MNFSVLQVQKLPITKMLTVAMRDHSRTLLSFLFKQLERDLRTLPCPLNQDWQIIHHRSGQAHSLKRPKLRAGQRWFSGNKLQIIYVRSIHYITMIIMRR